MSATRRQIPMSSKPPVGKRMITVIPVELLARLNSYCQGDDVPVNRSAFVRWAIETALERVERIRRETKA